MKNLTTSRLKSKFIECKIGEPKNLLLLVHGRTGNIRLLEWYSKRLEIPGMAFLTLEAPFPDQRPEQTDPGFSWYTGNYSGLNESRQLLRNLLDELSQQGVSAHQIYWLGFSQGAAMGLDLALRAPFVLGGFVCVSGFCILPEKYPQFLGEAAFNQRILITHGKRDPIVTLAEAEASYQKLRELKIPFDYQVFDKPHSFHLKTEVPMIEERLKAWSLSPSL